MCPTGLQLDGDLSAQRPTGQCISVGLLGASLRRHLLRPSSHSAGYLLDVFMVTQLILTLSNPYTFPLLVAAVDCLVTSEAHPIFNR